MEPHRGTLILVFGILSIVLCPFFGIAAWLMGNGDLKKIAAGQMDPEGEGQTKAGKICGIIGTVLMVLTIIFLIVWVIFVFVLVGVTATSSGMQVQ